MNEDTNTKPWYQSRTMWFNAVGVTLFYFESQMHVLKDMLPATLYPWLVLLLPLGNMLLRSVTDTAVTLKPVKPAIQEPNQ